MGALLRKTSSQKKIIPPEQLVKSFWLSRRKRGVQALFEQKAKGDFTVRGLESALEPIIKREARFAEVEEEMKKRFEGYHLEEMELADNLAKERVKTVIGISKRDVGAGLDAGLRKDLLGEDEESIRKAIKGAIFELIDWTRMAWTGASKIAEKAIGERVARASLEFEKSIAFDMWEVFTLLEKRGHKFWEDLHAIATERIDMLAGSGQMFKVDEDVIALGLTNYGYTGPRAELRRWITEEPSMRLQLKAINALGRIGNAKDVEFLKSLIVKEVHYKGKNFGRCEKIADEFGREVYVFPDEFIGHMLAEGKLQVKGDIVGIKEAHICYPNAPKGLRDRLEIEENTRWEPDGGDGRSAEEIIQTGIRSAINRLNKPAFN